MTALLEEEVPVQDRLIESPNVVNSLVDLTGDYDLTLIGATREGLFQQLLYGVIPEQVGQRAKNTVIMAKRDLGIVSRLKRWFRSRNG